MQLKHKISIFHFVLSIFKVRRNLPTGGLITLWDSAIEHHRAPAGSGERIFAI